jgi:hypothetical protein
MQYNGAFVDISFDNAYGDAINTYIVVPSEHEDYSSAAAWWEVNAVNPAATSGGTSAVDCVLEAVTGDEFGKLYTISTISPADGINDQSATITCKVRCKNTNTNTWSSDILSFTKTYDFNDWDSVMYYCADNPRQVDGEYANHANYLAQPYHTGTTKYTAPDGVDWIDDNRRLAYWPGFKIERLIEFLYQDTLSQPANMYEIWQDRKIGTLLTTGEVWEEEAATRMMIYACLYANFGDYNNSSSHCFATNSTQVYDNATAHQSPYPAHVLGDGATDLKYIQFSPTKFNDCSTHSSYAGVVIRLPSGDNWTWGQWQGRHDLLNDNQFYFAWGSNPWPGVCSEWSSACPGHSDEQYMFWIYSPVSSQYPDDLAPYVITNQKYWANTAINGVAEYGGVWGQYHSGQGEYPGCPEPLDSSW